MAAIEPQKPRRRKRRRLSRQQEQRRQILRAAWVGLVLLLLHPLGFLPVARRWHRRLRPPGALSERHFLGACIKCGQCVQVCPVEAIVLADVAEGFGSGVPYIDARVQACDFSCDALSCILACPTGALSHELKAKEEVRAGMAKLVRPDACLARRGEAFRGRARGNRFEGRLRYEQIDRWNPIAVRDHAYDRALCDLCVLECPIGEDALRLVPLADAAKPGAMTPEVGDACVGCGVCEMICPETPTCIIVEPGVQLPGVIS